jgi:ATP-binding cassette subfamily F protein uup
MAAPLLALKDVRLADGRRLMFDGVDLALEPRVRACLVGRNGAGKTTLLRILAGEIEADDGVRSGVPGLTIAFAPQEPQIGGGALVDYASSGGAPRHAAEAALQSFDLDPARSADGLSGGEARRAALAKVFAEDPDVLLLDEPTNHLDIFAIERLEARLAACRAAVLVVSHDRAFLERVTQRCFWLEERRVFKLDAGFAGFDAWSDKITAQREEDERRLSKTLEQEEYWLRRGVTARRARNEGRRRRLMALRQEKADVLRQARGELSVGLSSGQISGRRVIEARKLSKAFGERTIIKGFSTRILRGDRVAVVGPNGAGKTTLVKLLLGELAPDSGEVKLGVGLEVAYVDQARADLKPGSTLLQALAPAGGDQIMVRGAPRHVMSYAKDFLFQDSQLRQPVESLSGGERNRLLIARAFARPANLLVLDEPTNDLDMETLDLLEDLLSDYDGTLILVSHDRDFVDRLATSTIALDGTGRAVETPGGWSDFRSQNPDFFAFPAAPKAPALPAPRAAQRAKPPTKLSYNDQRRLETLEQLMPKLEAAIARHEATLADPGLYARAPKTFEVEMAALEKARLDLAASEDEWLALEERKAALG